MSLTFIFKVILLEFHWFCSNSKLWYLEPINFGICEHVDDVDDRINVVKFQPLPLITSLIDLDSIIDWPWFHHWLILIPSLVDLDFIIDCPWFHHWLTLIPSLIVLNSIIDWPWFHQWWPWLHHWFTLIPSLIDLDSIIDWPWFHH